jgi:hypothetical protein
MIEIPREIPHHLLGVICRRTLIPPPVIEAIWKMIVDYFALDDVPF